MLKRFLDSLIAGDVDVLAQEVVGERLMTYQEELRNYLLLDFAEHRIALYEKVMSEPLILQLNSESPLFLSKNKNIKEIMARPMSEDMRQKWALACSLATMPAHPIFRDYVLIDVIYRVSLYIKALELHAEGKELEWVAFELGSIAINLEKSVEIAEALKEREFRVIGAVVSKYIPLYL